MKPDKRDLAVGKALARNFSTVVKATGPCVLLHDDGEHCEGPIHAHHLVRRQTIRQRKGMFDTYVDYMIAVWDPRNGVPVCQRHHEQITNRVIQLPVGMIPTQAWDFAYQYELTDNLRREIA